MHWSLYEPFSGIEYLSMAALVAAALLTPSGLRTWLASAAQATLQLLGRHPLLGLGLLSLAWSCLPLITYHPVPRVHDEFSFLLMGDTFLEGRIAMPTHPMWRSFESFHIIQTPTYASKFPFFQGLVLAGGELLFFDPIAGVKLVGALAAVAVYWALVGWVAPRWALVGALVFTLHFGGFSYWSQSFFGGAAAALGGALLLGAYPRLIARPHVRDGVLMGVGLVILATTRPYEGLLLALPIAGALAVRGRAALLRLVPAMLPVALIFAFGLSAMGYYNHSVTGDAFTFPYEIYTERYGYARPFRFQIPHSEIALEHPAMQRFVDTFERDLYTAPLSERWRPLLRFYGAPLLLLPLLLAPCLIKHRRGRFAVVLASVCFGGLSLTTNLLPHYAAPFTALLMLLLVQCLRWLRGTTWRGRRIGRFAVSSVLIAWFYAWLLASAASAAAQARDGRPTAWNEARKRIEQGLVARGGKHLVFVHYADYHSPHDEWVYNRADIDAAAVVWAREVDSIQDLALRGYFCARHVWRVDADRQEVVKLRSPACEQEK